MFLINHQIRSNRRTVTGLLLRKLIADCMRPIRLLLSGLGHVRKKIEGGSLTKRYPAILKRSVFNQSDQALLTLYQENLR